MKGLFLVLRLAWGALLVVLAWVLLYLGAASLWNLWKGGVHFS